MCGCFSRGPHMDLACNPGMCPDWESNRQPFGSQPALDPLSYTSQSHLALFQFPCSITGQAGPALSCLVLSDASLRLCTASACGSLKPCPPSSFLACGPCSQDVKTLVKIITRHVHGHTHVRTHRFITTQGWLSPIRR